MNSRSNWRKCTLEEIRVRELFNPQTKGTIHITGESKSRPGYYIRQQLVKKASTEFVYRTP
jgi:hypothetical protein